MQKLRDSAGLELITKEVDEVEAKARELSHKIIDFLMQSRGAITLYSYSGYGYVPASLMYWYSLTFQSAKHPIIAEVEDTSTYLTPYRDDLSLIAFTTGEYPKLITALQAARALEIDYLAIAPEPSAENLKPLVKHYGVVTLPYQDKVKVTLAMVMAAFFALSELYKGSLSSRGRRLAGHGLEGFAITLRSFIEKYTPTIENVVRHPHITVTSSKFLEAPAVLLAYALRCTGASATYTLIEEALQLTDMPTLAVFLTTEERLRKEFKASRKGPLVELVLNVDPLEAGVYISLLSYVLARVARASSE
ncbi:MAG: hypothetical protein QXQ73_05400 [Desulfurococcaceae archaeon]